MERFVDFYATKNNLLQIDTSIMYENHINIDIINEGRSTF